MRFYTSAGCVVSRLAMTKRSPSAVNHGHMFTRDGRLVVSVAQEGLIRRVGNAKAKA
jgi:acyl-CoA thioesterase